MGRFALQSMKQVMDRGIGLDLRRALALETDAFGLFFARPDAWEGTIAFLEKRPPSFYEICPITRLIMGCSQSVAQASLVAAVLPGTARFNVARKYL